MACTTVVLFGISGDLAQHKLIPALFQLHKEGVYEPSLRIVGVGRRPYSREYFLTDLSERSYVQNADPQEWEHFKECFYYYQMDLEDRSAYEGLAAFLEGLGDDEGRIFYLSVPPERYHDTLTNLANADLHRSDKGYWRRIVVEKPFGTDQASARALDRHINGLFSENQVYRIDHYLTKETVQNVLAFRFANGLFESMWNGRHIDHIQITVAESEGIKSRGPYYDKAGAVKDVLQNHVLQLVSLLLLDEPDSFSFADVSDRKMQILKGLSIDPATLVFGQYEGYGQETGVQPESSTETFIMAGLVHDSERWKGVPIYVRTGKKMQKRLSEVSVQFKESHQRLFEHAQPNKSANVLTFRLQPDEGISLQLQVKTPRQKLGVQPVQMEFCYASAFRAALPDAYERLFLDILHGDQTYSLRSDVIEESWRIADQILSYKGDGRVLLPYAAESWGPEKADNILEAEGRRWLAHENEICNGIIVDN